ncbi:hypothetical protein [Cellulomonas soli]|nr:hypothetical protein [Cellulomonas soli]NYI60275.1 hypothetical protein [Cellulomonas soli]
MATRWSVPAGALLSGGEPTWTGLSALLDAASHATLTLCLAAPLGAGVDLAFAAIALGEALDEAAWLHEQVRQQPPARLGPLHIGDDLDESRHVVEQLLTTATAHTLLMIDEAATPEEVACLGRVLRRLLTAGEEFARAAA